MNRVTVDATDPIPVRPITRNVRADIDWGRQGGSGILFMAAAITILAPASIAIEEPASWAGKIEDRVDPRQRMAAVGHRRGYASTVLGKPLWPDLGLPAPTGPVQGFSGSAALQNVGLRQIVGPVRGAIAGCSWFTD